MKIGVAWLDARGVSILLRLSRRSLDGGRQFRTHSPGKDPMSNVSLSSDAAVRPEVVLEPSVEHRFRPVEGKWAINVHLQRESGNHAAELAQDTDAKPWSRCKL